MLTPSTKTDLIDRIRAAFAPNPYPGDWCLKGSTEGEEPYLVEEAFKGKDDWSALDPEFLDQAPEGYGSALSFFSDEAFRFYLPGYLIADVEGKLSRSNPVFHLTHGLDDVSSEELVNHRRYGAMTWLALKRCKFSVFAREEVEAIVVYLQWKLKNESLQSERDAIDQALRRFWEPRRAESRPWAALHG